MQPLKTKKQTTNVDRERIVLAYEKGYNMKEIAGMLQLKHSTVHGIIKRFRETGQTTATVRNTPCRKIIDSQHIQKIKDWIEEDCTITIKQIVSKLKAEYGIDVSKSTVARTTKSLQDTVKTPRNIRMLSRKSLLIASPTSSQPVMPHINTCQEINGMSKTVTPPPKPSRTEETPSPPEPYSGRAEETPPPGPSRIVSTHRRTTRALNRRTEDINRTHNKIILNTLQAVSAATNRLVAENQPQTNEAVFGAWVGNMLEEWSPPRRYTMKVAIRKMMLEADIARYRERTGLDIDTVVKTEI